MLGLGLRGLAAMVSVGLVALAWCEGGEGGKAERGETKSSVLARAEHPGLHAPQPQPQQPLSGAGAEGVEHSGSLHPLAG